MSKGETSNVNGGCQGTGRDTDYEYMCSPAYSPSFTHHCSSDLFHQNDLGPPMVYAHHGLDPPLGVSYPAEHKRLQALAPLAIGPAPTVQSESFEGALIMKMS